jgi:hypothetical protein
MVSEGGSMTSDLLALWREKIYKRRPSGIFLNSHVKPSNGPKYRSMLCIDSASSHRSAEFKKIMGKNFDSKLEIIPAGITPLIQPADVSWNKSVKARQMETKTKTYEDNGENGWILAFIPKTILSLVISKRPNISVWPTGV